MAVRPELWRKGIGSRLVERGLEECRRAGYGRLRARRRRSGSAVSTSAPCVRHTEDQIDRLAEALASV